MNSSLDRQHLLFDADDTLWENNVHFERAFDDFVAFLKHEEMTPPEIRTMFDKVERETVSTLGYGARGFSHSLRETFIQLNGNADAEALATVERLGLRILDIEIELLAGVQETLAALKPHHDLVLVTKGQDDEQSAKIARAQIAHLFDETIVTAEKHPETYRSLVTSMDFDLDRSWMIGNSPRSDINPALEAGLHAIYVPHPMTWHFEHVDIADHPEWQDRLVTIERFDQLTTIFRHEAAP